jgi:hypothetical protein
VLALKYDNLQGGHPVWNFTQTVKILFETKLGFSWMGGTNSIHNFQMVKLAATLCHDSQQA